MSEEDLVDFKNIPRATEANHFNYDELTLARRTREIEAAAKDYPNLNVKQIEMVWDFIQTSESEERAMEDVKKWEKEPAKERDTA